MSNRQSYRIPFNKPFFSGEEIANIVESINRGRISGDGYFTKQCQAYIEQALGIDKCLLTTSCTHALEMAALLLDIQPGDEVIVPTFTFVSTVNAFALRGAKPVFIDIRADTLNFDEELLAGLLSEKTKAIVVVHYGGVGCEMEVIMRLAQARGIPVVEDCAHALFATYQEKNLGSFGALAALSFHETKNIICGEGGALLINDPALVARAEILREKGTNRAQFFRGQVDKYTWVDLGSSYLPSDILAAFLFAQLQNHRKIQEKRRAIWEYYYHHLHGWAAANGVGVPVVPAHCRQSHHLFYLLLPSDQLADALIAHLGEKGILGVFHYQPLHLSKMGRSFGGREGQHPVAERLSGKIVRLPFYFDLTDAELAEVVGAVLDFSC